MNSDTIGCLFWCILIIMAAIFIPMFFIHGIPFQTGEGEHIGIVNSVNNNGIFFKSKTVYIKSSAYASSISRYCITDEKLYKNLFDIANDQKTISFEFKQIFMPGFNCSSDQIITNFKVLK